MSRLIVNALAAVGVTFLLVSSVGWAGRRNAAPVITGQVLDSRGRPLVELSVFLDRGTNLVERYATDSAGTFRLPLFPHEPHRATWLICAPGASPIIGKPDRDEFARLGATFRAYEVTLWRDSVFHFYRMSGWSGPIPRECPRAIESAGWRYPASAGRDWGETTATEPEWARFPGPPALPAP